MYRNKVNWVLFLTLLAAFAITQTIGAAEGPQVVRLDLEAPDHFVIAETMGITPFLRLGNVFFAEVGSEQLRTIRDAGIPCSIIDDQPFSGHYYLGSVESLLSWKKPRADFELLADLDGRALYKTPTPIDPVEARHFEEEVFEVGTREIPLVYRPTETVTLNPASLAADPYLEALIGLVSQDSIYAYNCRLEDFQTRLTFTDSNVASRDWIAQKFADFGYTEISLDEFWCDDNRKGGSGYTHNVVCVKYGTAEPDKVVVIGGHYDSIVYDGNDAYFIAPGADDNASGVAGTLEIARLLAGVDTDRTIVFIAFGAEESGLHGSWHYAEEAYNAGEDIRLMINMDMIGHTDDDEPDIRCRYPSSSMLYARMIADYCLQYTGLIPGVYTAGGNSDHWPFAQYGYNSVFVQEGDFDTYGIHTVSDVTTRMDFEYQTEAVKMCLASLYAASVYPPVIEDAAAWDIGDGQSLSIEWTPPTAEDITGFVIWWGIESKNYTDSETILNPTASSHILNGLTDDQLYYLTLVAIDSDGYESFARPEFTGRPRAIPLPPDGFFGEPGSSQIFLGWQPNEELDFSHYNIYRGTESGVYSLLESNWTSTDYHDTGVTPGVEYFYALTAVDAGSNESPYSDEIAIIAADFDGGIFLIDATPLTPGNPSAMEKQAFYDFVFEGLPVTYYAYDTDSDSLPKSTIAQYGTVCWIDDDHQAALWKDYDVDLIRWYMDYPTNVILAGWRIVYELAGLNITAEFDEGDFLYDYIKMYGSTVIAASDYEGAEGKLSFPDINLDETKFDPGWDGTMSDVGTMRAYYNSEEIYEFDSRSATHNTKSVGLRQDRGDKKRVLLSMPFYYSNEVDARAAIYNLMIWLGFQPPCLCHNFGDLDHSGSLNPVDVVLLVMLVYKGQQMQYPPDPLCVQGEQASDADWNCDGAINPVDVVYSVNYVYKALGGLCDPCACSPYPDNCP